MHSRLLVNKLFAENQTTTKFLEKYYSEKVGYDIKIKLDPHTRTSYFNSPVVHISAHNLYEFIDYNPKLFRPLFYTLLLHEIGHAIYTDALAYTMTTNVLEDNRLEYNISLWNARVRFRLFRYVFQDKKIAEAIKTRPERLLSDKTLILLSLLRTIDNTKYIHMLGFTLERKQIISEILSLNEEYTKKDYELSREYQQKAQDIKELSTISDKVDALVNKLIDLRKEEQEQEKEQKQQGNEKKKQQKQQEETQEEAQQKQQEKAEEEENDLENGLTQLMQESERMQLDPEYNTPILYNEHGDRNHYNKYKISLFDTARHSGIKNTADTQASRGNIKQLNMQRYMRRHIVRGEKLFDKKSFYGSGGKGAKVCFYLDISGSMSDENKLRIASDYLKSFYDTMHKRIDIRMFGFGRYTYKITRNELNYMFLRNSLEGATRIQEVKPRPKETIIVLTDGIIDNRLSENIKHNAHFVIIETSYRNQKMKDNYRRYFNEYKHRIFVNPQDIVKGLERATQQIRSALLKWNYK